MSIHIYRITQIAYLIHIRMPRMGNPSVRLSGSYVDRPLVDIFCAMKSMQVGDGVSYLVVKDNTWTLPFLHSNLTVRKGK